ncbi:MAG: helix-turn-helix transcriptional regulator [Steroidobacteraceae bacterium]
MLEDHNQWVTLVDAFSAAAIDGQSWYSALEQLASATGSRSAQLIGLTVDAGVPVNLMTNIDPACLKVFTEVGGGDPRVNPRARVVNDAPILKVLAEADFLPPDQYRCNPHYQEFARPWDIPFICLTTLERANGNLIALCVCRSGREGHITTAQREIFAAIAPHVRASVRAHLALESQGTALLANTLERLSIAAFLCDRTQRVRVLTKSAEALLSADGGLQLKNRQLQALRCDESRGLADAIGAAALGRSGVEVPVLQPVVVHGRKSHEPPLVLDVISLSSRHRTFEFFNFTPCVLVVARGARTTNEQTAAILQTIYALTVAESDIATHLAAGRTAEFIAENRGVTVGTVRAQTKAIMAKVGVNRQAELASRLSRL